MLQVGGELNLLEKPLSTEHGRQLGVENLYRDFSIVLLVVCEIDGGHSTAAQFTLDRTSGERALNLLNGLGHSVPDDGGDRFTVTTK